MHIDGTVYPDCDPPKVLSTPEEKADYLHRICSAWDFYVQPDPETFQELSHWKDIFDRFPVVTSPAYHAFRAWFGWEAVAVPSGLPPYRPRYLALDALEGRGDDPCEGMV